MLFIDLYSEYISFPFKANAIFDPEKCSSVPIFFFLTFEEEISIGRKNSYVDLSLSPTTRGVSINGKIEKFYSSHTTGPVNCSFFLFCSEIFVILCPCLCVFGQRLLGLQFYDIMTALDSVLDPSPASMEPTVNTNDTKQDYCV